MSEAFDATWKLHYVFYTIDIWLQAIRALVVEFAIVCIIEKETFYLFDKIMKFEITITKRKFLSELIKEIETKTDCSVPKG